MALFTKLFSRDVEPYDTKTRWYKIHIKSDGTTPSLVDHDSFFSGVTFDGTTYVVFNSTDKMVIDYEVHADLKNGTSVTFQKAIYLGAVSMRLRIPPADRYSDMIVYVKI